MLVGLNINNVALIESVDMELREGLNVLTGETGAGKSIIIDSINAVLGERLSKDLIRTGTEKAVVEAVFIVDNDKLSGVFESMGITPEDDGTLVISREYSVSGRNICRINGRAATVTMLKELGEHLIDIHGQYDNQSLLKVDRHIELLDLFSGDVVKDLKREYVRCLEEYRSIRNKMAELMGDRNERERRLDLLRYQIDEIENARLKPGEDESLEKQRVILSSTEKIIDALNDSYDLLYSGGDIKSSALDSINRAISEINGISRIDEKYVNISKRLEEISYLLDDVSEEIRKEKDGMELSPGILEQIEERLDAIYRLKRKYGSSIDEILKYRDKISSELEEIENSEELVAKLTEMLKKNDLELYNIAKKLHEERSKACEILENGIS
ncbi:MAG TPA: AAA family ATPase, partial [Clostridia bacterium]